MRAASQTPTSLWMSLAADARRAQNRDVGQNGRRSFNGAGGRVRAEACGEPLSLAHIPVNQVVRLVGLNDEQLAVRLTPVRRLSRRDSLPCPSKGSGKRPLQSFSRTRSVRLGPSRIMTDGHGRNGVVVCIGPSCESSTEEDRRRDNGSDARRVRRPAVHQRRDRRRPHRVLAVIESLLVKRRHDEGNLL
jgi:hypothetical protein